MEGLPARLPGPQSNTGENSGTEDHAGVRRFLGARPWAQRHLASRSQRGSGSALALLPLREGALWGRGGEESFA